MKITQRVLKIARLKWLITFVLILSYTIVEAADNYYCWYNVPTDGSGYSTLQIRVTYKSGGTNTHTLINNYDATWPGYTAGNDLQGYFKISETNIPVSFTVLAGTSSYSWTYDGSNGYKQFAITPNPEAGTATWSTNVNLYVDPPPTILRKTSEGVYISTLNEQCYDKINDQNIKLVFNTATSKHSCYDKLYIKKGSVKSLLYSAPVASNETRHIININTAFLDANFNLNNDLVFYLESRRYDPDADFAEKITKDTLKGPIIYESFSNVKVESPSELVVDTIQVKFDGFVADVELVRDFLVA
jgi:hypothetical protein